MYICIYTHTHMYIYMNLDLINEAVQNTRNTVEIENSVDMGSGELTF